MISWFSIAHGDARGEFVGVRRAGCFGTFRVAAVLADV